MKHVSLLMMMSVALLSFSVNAAKPKANGAQAAGRVYCSKDAKGVTQCGNVPLGQQAEEISTRTGLSISKTDPAVVKPLPEAGVDPVTQALLESYPDEQALRRHYDEKRRQINEQRALLEQSRANQQKALMAMLNKAANQEMIDKKVPLKLQQDIQKVHQQIVDSRRRDKDLIIALSAIDDDETKILETYRQAKSGSPYVPPTPVNPTP